RRRHTRFSRDWSSDVCSSDLVDQRKMRILQAVTDDYILTAEPVGSRTIARKYSLGISPATIRNEMADLEELGYLQQPHASAGRKIGRASCRDRGTTSGSAADD